MEIDRVVRMPGRVTLLLSSPRVVPGVLTREAWDALGRADVVFGRTDEPQVSAVSDAGVGVTAAPDEHPAPLGRALVARALTGADVVWVVSSDGDPGLTDAVAAEVTRLPDPPEVEVVLGSHDPPGSRLLDLVAVMDRLRSPGGCPWDREQTHASLVPYLIEEAHEAAEALESGDRAHMVEELGDVLLQVAFHARVAEDDPDDPFDIDDVAGAIVAKLVRRHPHVFADGDATSAAEVESTWEEVKAEERRDGAGATSDGVDGSDAPEASDDDLLHGIPVAMPPLARATKVVSRLRRAGREDLLEPTAPLEGPEGLSSATEARDPGDELLALVRRLVEQGVDPDAALRGALRRLVERVDPSAPAS